MASVLTPLQLTSTANLLQNQGFSASTLDNAITSYTSTALITPLANTVVVGSIGNILSANVLANVVTLAANSCPALSDSIPAANAASFPTELMTTLLSNTANTYLGNGDVSKFAQALAIAQGYCTITNQFINSAVNSQTYLGNTFTNFNNMISGEITQVNLCTTQWAEDLKNLGGLINLSKLEDLGTPIALITQLASLGGVIPEIAIAFTEYRVSLDTVVNLNNPNLVTTDADQRAMYQAMTHITGEPLAQILQVLGVTTVGIETMADLLNPFKLFPNSFQTLTVTDINLVSQNIYINSAGTVNGTLITTLPTIALSTSV